jgi:hypothetical protein
MTDQRRAGETAPDDALDLSKAEVELVARRLLADRINQDDDWFSWEDYPLLSESSALRLSQEIDHLRREAHRESSRLDRSYNIDSVQLLDQAAGR